jgi:hypothetical protein
LLKNTVYLTVENVRFRYIYKLICMNIYDMVHNLFEDDTAWENHYNDWKNILSKITVHENDTVYEPTVSQTEYRVSVIKDLIKSYEISHK